MSNFFLCARARGGATCVEVGRAAGTCERVDERGGSGLFSHALMTSLLEQHIAALRAARDEDRAPAAAEAAGASGPRHPNAATAAAVARLSRPRQGQQRRLGRRAQPCTCCPQPGWASGRGGSDRAARLATRAEEEIDQSGVGCMPLPPMLLAGFRPSIRCRPVRSSAQRTQHPAARARLRIARRQLGVLLQTHAQQPPRSLYEFSDVHPPIASSAWPCPSFHTLALAAAPQGESRCACAPLLRAGAPRRSRDLGLSAGLLVPHVRWAKARRRSLACDLRTPSSRCLTAAPQPIARCGFLCSSGRRKTLRRLHAEEPLLVALRQHAIFASPAAASRARRTRHR